jgi:hypothetical protein
MIAAGIIALCMLAAMLLVVAGYQLITGWREERARRAFMDAHRGWMRR